MPHPVTALTYTHTPQLGERADAIRRVTLVLEIGSHHAAGPFAKYVKAAQGLSAGGGMVVVSLYSLLEDSPRMQEMSSQMGLVSGLWRLDPSVAWIPRQQPGGHSVLPCVTVAGLDVFLGMTLPESIMRLFADQDDGPDNVRSCIADPVYAALQVATGTIALAAA